MRLHEAKRMFREAGFVIKVWKIYLRPRKKSYRAVHDATGTEFVFKREFDSRRWFIKKSDVVACIVSAVQKTMNP